MNLFELIGFVVGIILAIVLASIGFSHWGWLGIIAGVPIGFIIGWCGGAALVAIFFGVGIFFERTQLRFRLRKIFGHFWTAEFNNNWSEFKQNVEVGETMTGIVKAKFYYGLYIDIGSTFPAHLKTVSMPDLSDIGTIEIGDKIEAKVHEFDDAEHTLVLTQLEMQNEQ